TVDELGRLLAVAFQTQAGDLAPGSDQPAKRRGVADDARMVAGVARGRDDRRQLVDPDLAADAFELAAAFEFVDERDRVDRLAAAVQVERRPVDLGVALSVEIRGRERLADRP